MPRHQPILLEYGEYLALRTVASSVQWFDVEQNLRTAARVGSLFFRSNRERRRRAEQNIALSFPEWDAERVAAVAERSMQHMFQLFLVEALAAPRHINDRTWTNHVRIGQLGLLMDRLVSGRPLILLTSHTGNWELLGHVMALLGYPISALARPLDNRFINAWLMGIREARGTRILTKWGATPVAQHVLASGGRLGFTADQNAGSQGLFVPFFGRLASSYKSIGLLAMRYDVPIAAGCAHRVGPGLRYVVSCTDYIDPIDWKDQDDPLFYITARFNHAMEQMVRAVPEQYLWIHRRWKSRPQHELLGRPVPSRLVEKLRNLPWMTSDELEQIVERSNRAAAEQGR